MIHQLEIASRPRPHLSPDHSMEEAYLTELVVLAEILGAGPDEDLVEVARRRMDVLALLDNQLGKALERLEEYGDKR